VKNSQELLDELENEVTRIKDQKILHEDRTKELSKTLLLLREKVNNLQGIEKELQAVQAEVISPIRGELDDIRDAVGPIKEGLERLKGESEERTRYSKRGLFLNKTGLWVGVISLLAAGLFQLMTTRDLQKATSRAAVLNLKMGTGHPNGVYYPVGAAITNVVNQSLPDVSMQIVPSEASVQNLHDLLSGETQVAIIQSDVVRAAFLNPALFTLRYGMTVDASRIAVIGSLFDENCHIVVRSDHISNYKDMGSKVIDIGQERSGSRFSSLSLLNELNIKPQSMKTSPFLSPIAALTNQDISGFMLWEALGSEQIGIELQIDKIKILPLDEDAIQKLEKQGDYERSVIPAGTYPHQTLQLPTVRVRALLVCARSLPDDIVYRMIEAMYSSNGGLSRYHKAGIAINRTAMLEGIKSFREAGWLHPAAQAYYDKNVAAREIR
jgi:TRAP transporter TAXI family solute receptor